MMKPRAAIGGALMFLLLTAAPHPAHVAYVFELRQPATE
jgi:hypothetical protein